MAPKVPESHKSLEVTILINETRIYLHTLRHSKMGIVLFGDNSARNMTGRLSGVVGVVVF
jgi:hypothetical protein